MSSIDREKPLLGEPLNSVLTWNAANSAAGCYCELGDRTAQVAVGARNHPLRARRARDGSTRAAA